MHLKSSLLKFLLAFILIVSYWACETTEDGCLDLLSKNYGFESVNACDSCCVYPDFKIGLNLFNDTIPNALNDTIIIDGVDTLYFRKIDLLFSEFIINGQSDTYRIRDSIFINGNAVRDDYAYFQSPTAKTLGQTRIQDTIKGISCYLGFNESSLQEYLPFENINSESQIDGALDSLYNSENDEYYFSRLTIEFADSTRQLLLKNPNIQLEITKEFIVNAGEDWSFDFNLNLIRLSDGLKREMSDEEIIRTFEGNIIPALSVN